MPLNLKVTDERTLLLLEDVAKIVEQGGTIKIAKDDRFNTFIRYLDNSKRNMTTTAGSLATATSLGGPIGLLVAAAGKLIMFGGGAIIEGFKKWRKGKNYRRHKQSGTDIVWKREGRDLVYDKVYGEEIIEDVKYLLEHQGFTDIYNAFANLDGDFSKLNKFMPGTFPPAEWHNDPEQDTFGPTWKVENDPSWGARRRFEIAAHLKNSDDAVELWEIICRIQYRYQQVREAIEILQEFIEYITAAISVFDADTRNHSARLWAIVTQNGTAKVGEVLDFLNDVINRKGVQEHFGRRFLGRQKNYHAWAYNVLPDFIKRSTPSLAVAVLVKTDSSQLKNLVMKVAYQTGTEFIGFDPQDYNDAGAWANFLAQTSVNAVGSLVQDQLTGEFKSTSTSLLSGAFGQFSQPGSPAIEAFVNVAVEIGNRAWEEYQLSKGKTFSVTKGVHQQSIAERIGLLRNQSKEAVEDYVGVIEDWQEAYEMGKNPPNREAAAEALLRFHKCEQLYYKNRVGQMQNEVVWAVIQLVNLTERATVSAAEAIENFISDDQESYIDNPGSYYYGSLYKALWDIGLAIKDPIAKNEARRCPVTRVNQSDELQELFKDKNRLLSKDLVLAPTVTAVKMAGYGPWSLGIPKKAEWKQMTSSLRSKFKAFASEAEKLIEEIDDHLDQLHASSTKLRGQRILRDIQEACNIWLKTSLSTPQGRSAVFFMKDAVTQKLEGMN